jgi:hypothetical protein
MWLGIISKCAFKVKGFNSPCLIRTGQFQIQKPLKKTLSIVPLSLKNVHPTDLTGNTKTKKNHA